MGELVGLQPDGENDLKSSELKELDGKHNDENEPTEAQVEVHNRC